MYIKEQTQETTYYILDPLGIYKLTISLFAQFLLGHVVHSLLILHSRLTGIFKFNTRTIFWKHYSKAYSRVTAYNLCNGAKITEKHKIEKFVV